MKLFLAKKKLKKAINLLLGSKIVKVSRFFKLFSLTFFSFRVHCMLIFRLDYNSMDAIIAGSAAAEFSARALPGFLQNLGSTTRFLPLRIVHVIQSCLPYGFFG